MASHRWRAAIFAGIFVFTMFTPIPAPVEVAGIPLLGASEMCAQEIQCFDDEGNYIECPPEVPSGGGGGGEETPPPESSCDWYKVGLHCAACASGPFWNPMTVFHCGMCAYHLGKCAVG